MSMRGMMMYPERRPVVDMQARTVTLPLGAYLDLCNKHQYDEEEEDYLMYVYKIKRCTRTRPHDWTECPLAHTQEKARRRDPRKFPYMGVVCPDYKNGECLKGLNCEYAHGIFEYWLHPSKFRTRPCESGLHCTRRICFFAHTREQLRAEGVHHCSRCGNRGHPTNAAAAGGHAEWRGAGRARAAATAVAAAKAEVPLAVPTRVAPPPPAAPSTSGGRAKGPIVNPVDAKYSDYPHLGMIVDLVNW